MGDKIKRVPQKKKSDRQSKRKKRVAKYHREEREDPSEKHTSSNPTFFFLVHFQVFTGLSALVVVRTCGGSTQKSPKKSHSCCPCLSNSNPQCENTQILHSCVQWEKTQVNTHTHTHTHTHSHIWYTQISTTSTGGKTYLDIHIHSHLWYTQISTTSTGEKNLRGHIHIFTLMVHTQVSM